VAEPANVLTPTAFAEACAGLRDHGLEVEILEQADLERIGMRTLLAVAQGSALPAYVAVMRWRGGGSGERPPLALIGKGVCFDTGGISIKPAAGMEEMKGDMAGAAAVFGAMRALASRGARADVVGLVGLAENMPSGTAIRPGDVVKTLAGKTVEIINTDAEGRLLLADVLWYAQDRFKPRAMVDLATLTGAVVVALGREHGGLFASDEELARRLLDAGRRDRRAPVAAAARQGLREARPLRHRRPEERRPRPRGGSSAGAVFLQQFTNGVPWAHLDIAAMSWTSRDLPLAPKGATGFGVRLLDRLVAGYEAG
jgi:leucyl aminopeptidase